MTDAITYSRNGKLWTGMTIEDARNAVNNKTYRNEKAQNRAMDNAILRFEKADKNSDGVLDLQEIEQYNKDVIKKNVKTALTVTAGAVVAAGVAYLAIKGIKANKAAQMLDFDKALKADATRAFAEVTPDNFKGQGVSFLVDAEKSGTAAYKLKMGKTVGETLDLNKEVGLELVQEATGKHVFGVKNPWTGWENLPDWKNEYGSLSFQELKKIYPDLNAEKYFTLGGPGMIKAYSATVENGVTTIGKTNNGVADIAFQVNSTAGRKGAKDLVNMTHILEDGSAIKFDDLQAGWTMVKKGQYNPADPSNPLPLVQTVLGFENERTIKTLEGAIKSDITMTDAGGFPYNKFKDFWKQVTRGKVKVNPQDANSVKMFNLASTEGVSEDVIKALIKNATKA